MQLGLRKRGSKWCKVPTTEPDPSRPDPARPGLADRRGRCRGARRSAAERAGVGFVRAGRAGWPATGRCPLTCRSGRAAVAASPLPISSPPTGFQHFRHPCSFGYCPPHPSTHVPFCIQAANSPTTSSLCLSSSQAPRPASLPPTRGHSCAASQIAFTQKKRPKRKAHTTLSKVSRFENTSESFRP